MLEKLVAPYLRERLAAENLKASIERDGGDLLLFYAPTVEYPAYVQPRIKLEFGARLTGEPAEARAVSCYMAEAFPELSFPEAAQLDGVAGLAEVLMAPGAGVVEVFEAAGLAVGLAENLFSTGLKLAGRKLAGRKLEASLIGRPFVPADGAADSGPGSTVGARRRRGRASGRPDQRLKTAVQAQEDEL